MNGTQFRRTIRWIPLLISFCAALAALTVVAWAALFERHAVIPWTQPLIGNAVGVARTYLFRNALRNTVALLAPLWVGVFVLTVFAYGRRATTGEVRRRLPSPIYALAIAPLFLPTPCAAYLWRPLFRHVDMSSTQCLGLAAIAIVQVWRLWPLAIVTAPMLRSVLPARGAILVALSAVLLAFVDVGTPLTMTGGEPYNDTHLWATWSFHSLWVSRHWGYGAVMIGGMALFTGGIAGLLWLVGSRGGEWGSGSTPAWETYLGNMTVVAAACSALVPLVWMLPILVLSWQRAALSGEFFVEYVRWAALSLLFLLFTTLLASLIVSLALSAEVGRHNRVVAACFVVGLAVIPVWDWVGLRWMSWHSTWYEPLLVVFSAGITTGLVALWPTLAAVQENRYRRWHDGYGMATLVLLVVASLVTGNQFAIGVAAGEGSGILTLAAGPALRLSTTTSGSELVMATILSYALTFSVATALAFAISRTDSTRT